MRKFLVKPLKKGDLFVVRNQPTDDAYIFGPYRALVDIDAAYVCQRYSEWLEANGKEVNKRYHEEDVEEPFLRGHSGSYDAEATVFGEWLQTNGMAEKVDCNVAVFDADEGNVYFHGESSQPKTNFIP